MVRAWVIPLGVILAAFAGGAARESRLPTGGDWDEAAAREAKAEVQKGMNAFAAMDRETFKAGIAAEIVGYDLDLENQPVRLGSRDEALAYFDAMSAQVKKMGGKMKIEFRSIDCRATSTLAYATVEFDFSATMGDGSTMSQPSRVTCVLHKGNDGWKWVHWHTSLSALPTTPPPPSGK